MHKVLLSLHTAATVQRGWPLVLGACRRMSSASSGSVGGVLGCNRNSQSVAPARPTLPHAQLLDAIRRTPAAAPAAPPMLTDRFGRTHNYLRMSLTERCNLRCTYCMPEEGVDLSPSDRLLSSAEVQRVLSLFVQQGVNKVRFTGGEPTVRRDLTDIIAGAASLRPQGLDAIGLTSNGLVLARSLPALVDAGLTHLNISLDTLDPLQFALLTRRPAAGHALVCRAIDAALSLLAHSKAARARGEFPTRGLRSVKINCVMIRGLNERELLDFVEFTRHRDVEVRFIEYMPFNGNAFNTAKMLPYADMVAQIRAKHPTFARQPAEANETAKTWAVPGFAGRVGFITSMSEHFCATCNRLRITADGQLKVCLFGEQEVSLRDALRDGCSDEELALIVGAAVQKKKAQHAGMTQLTSTAQLNRPMIKIGG